MTGRSAGNAHRKLIVDDSRQLRVILSQRKQHRLGSRIGLLLILGRLGQFRFQCIDAIDQHARGRINALGRLFRLGRIQLQTRQQSRQLFLVPFLEALPDPAWPSANLFQHVGHSAEIPSLVLLERIGRRLHFAAVADRAGKIAPRFAIAPFGHRELADHVVDARLQRRCRHYRDPPGI